MRNLCWSSTKTKIGVRNTYMDLSMRKAFRRFCQTKHVVENEFEKSYLKNVKWWFHNQRDHCSRRMQRGVRHKVSDKELEPVPAEDMEVSCCNSEGVLDKESEWTHF
ncbi:unnamed protein product [Heterobilharzia americana]|nr:unnamed protein product [Heterobilharzia americana]